LLLKIGEGKCDESRQPVAMGNRMTALLREWVFPSLKLRGKRPISESQLVKDHIRHCFIETA